MKKYEKPSMTRRELFSEQKIANTCWGYHSGGSPTWWYDKNGSSAGFVSFYIGDGQRCGDISDLVKVTWYQNRAALNAGQGIHVIKDQTVTTAAGNEVQPFNDTVAYLEAAGGNKGTPFSGESGLILDNTGMS